MGTGHPKLMLATCIAGEWGALQNELLELQKAVERFDEKAVLRIIQRVVPEFTRNLPLQKAEVIPLRAWAKSFLFAN